MHTVLEQQLSKSAVFLLCNPNNPNGHLWNKEELKETVCLCKKHSVFILSDDIHMDFVYKPNRFIPVSKVSKSLDYKYKTIIITSSSKTFNLSALKYRKGLPELKRVFDLVLKTEGGKE